MTFSKTNHLQRKVNVTLLSIIKDALSNSTQFKDTLASFFLTVQVS